MSLAGPSGRESALEGSPRRGQGLLEAFPEAFAPLPKLTSDSEVCDSEDAVVVVA